MNAITGSDDFYDQKQAMLGAVAEKDDVISRYLEQLFGLMDAIYEKYTEVSYDLLMRGIESWFGRLEKMIDGPSFTAVQPEYLEELQKIIGEYSKWLEGLAADSSEGLGRLTSESVSVLQQDMSPREIVLGRVYACFFPFPLQDEGCEEFYEVASSEIDVSEFPSALDTIEQRKAALVRLSQWAFSYEKNRELLHAMKDGSGKPILDFSDSSIPNVLVVLHEIEKEVPLDYALYTEAEEVFFRAYRVMARRIIDRADEAQLSRMDLPNFAEINRLGPPLDLIKTKRKPPKHILLTGGSGRNLY